MTIETRTQALLDLVEDDRSTQCDRILDEARARASTLLAQAHADARVRMREAFVEERQRAQERVAAAHATLQTRRRLHDQRRAGAMLALGWRQLPDALLQRWHEPALRQRWVDAIMATARGALPRGPWRIAHGPEWPAAERQQLLAQLTADLDAAPTLVADAGIVAGLTVTAGGNVVDGTLAGLVDDRSEVGAQLLRHLEAST
jgi:vacuolar-type H+-ATPase subunit H